jgi:hypothetical protein
MKIRCLDDTHVRVRWGRAIQAAASARGWDARLFTRAEEVDGGYAFLRIEQQPPRLQEHKAVADALLACGGVRVIPGARQIRWYEDKCAQAADLGAYMPLTRLCYGMEDVESAIAALGFPLVSKSSEGSSCANVRLVKDRAEALAEARAAFGGEGIPMRLGGRAHRQAGYLLWQQFLAGNDYMYRVGVCGRFKWMFREGNRPGLPFASGSGLYTPVERLAGETAALFEAAGRYCLETGETWAGLDFARDPATGEWKLLETTLAWGMAHPGSTLGCVLFDAQGNPTARRGDRLWDALLDEIEAGVFG